MGAVLLCWVSCGPRGGGRGAAARTAEEKSFLLHCSLLWSPWLLSPPALERCGDREGEGGLSGRILAVRGPIRATDGLDQNADVIVFGAACIIIACTYMHNTCTRLAHVQAGRCVHVPGSADL